jgi:3-deoxy-D-manno-octulosonic acid (KDO) 8-phosphate synthase
VRSRTSTVPIKRRATLKPKTVQEIAQSILEIGQQALILVRRDGDRFGLVNRMHRLEACKALGEETIYGYLVQSQKRKSAKASTRRPGSKC